MLAAPCLHGWRVTVLEGPVDGRETSAQIVIEYETHRATLVVSPHYATRCINTLDEIVAHEIGHIVVGDVFEYIEPSRARDEACETLAERVGLAILALTGDE